MNYKLGESIHTSFTNAFDHEVKNSIWARLSERLSLGPKRDLRDAIGVSLRVGMWVVKEALDDYLRTR